MKQKKITTIEGLATLMQREFLVIHEKFDAMDQKMDAGFEKVNQKMDIGFAEIRQEIREIRQDIEDLKLRMGEAAHQFEVKELESRIRRLETKLGIV